jgi:hypothetical protein
MVCEAPARNGLRRGMDANDNFREATSISTARTRTLGKKKSKIPLPVFFLILNMAGFYLYLGQVLGRLHG